VREEIGQELSIRGLLGLYTGIGAAHCVNLVFTAQTDSEILAPGKDDSILAAKWFRVPEILALPDDQILNPRKLRQILSDYQSREPFDLDCIREDLYG